MNAPTLHHIHLAETDSTNRYAREHTPDAAITLISTDYQTAGRGQRGNTWESAAGMNLLFTLIVKPRGVAASQQFALSELISVALCEVLGQYTPDIHVKWPNDIYHRDHKLCGILIEHDLEGTHLTRSLIGVGVNVNQTCFTGDAPNPTSLALILGHEVEREALLRAIAHRFAELYTQYTCLPALPPRHRSRLPRCQGHLHRRPARRSPRRPPPPRRPAGHREELPVQGGGVRTTIARLPIKKTG